MRENGLKELKFIISMGMLRAVAKQLCDKLRLSWLAKLSLKLKNITFEFGGMI